MGYYNGWEGFWLVVMFQARSIFLYTYIFFGCKGNGQL
jgi:hypothetical protein